MDYTTEAILEGISKSNNDVLNYIYKNFFPGIRTFIENNSGNEDDARDLFQEAIIIIYRKIKKDKISLECNFKTYIFSICRLLWLKQLRSSKDTVRISLEDTKEDFIEDLSPDYLNSQRYKMYQTHFKRLGLDCQEVLQLSLKKVSLKKIADAMGYKSEKYAKKKRHICKQMLVKSIKADNEFNNLDDE